MLLLMLVGREQRTSNNNGMIEKELLLLMMADADGDSRLPLFSLTPSLKSFSLEHLLFSSAFLVLCWLPPFSLSLYTTTMDGFYLTQPKVFGGDMDKRPHLVLACNKFSSSFYPSCTSSM
jgi:hypothetical protein